MCLAYKYEKKFKGNTGWKLLYPKGKNGVLRSGMMYTGEYQEGKFTEVPSTFPSSIPLAKDEGTYPAGSHIFTRREDAERVLACESYRNLVLCKVQFKEQVAYGEVHWVLKKSDCSWCDATPDVIAPTVIARQVKVLEIIE